MKNYKKYPNRRLYDIEQSSYVTLDEIRGEISKGESISVVDSKSGKDLTRGVLMQIITDQEGEGHEPILTNTVIEQLIRFYGNSMHGLVSRYIEQSIMTFISQQQKHRKRMKSLTDVDPSAFVRKALRQNLDFWTSLANTSKEDVDKD